MSQISEQCYCAFCKEPRRIYSKRHLSSLNIFLGFLTSLLLMFILWQSPDPRVLFIFVLSLITAEIFIQFRWRLTMACPRCGFNPLLYIKNPELAAKKVNEFFERKKQDPAFYLSQNPLIKVAIQQAKAKNKNIRKLRLRASESRNSQKDSGQLLSKTL